ncbi:tyrosine-type recombinase/integrase [Foetidibacter luteolus]|uniref:tyrosine-type recombinase/integrase n=1 Tax=Foetidibacter luteolus TaxID=2608880 RepID=UPI001A994684|nr:site-specific integrase [Foetidibacter luteolus]
MKATDALKWALEKKKPGLARKSVVDYESMLEFTLASAKNLNYQHLQISDFKRFNVLSLLERLCIDKNLSNHAYNKYATFICGLFSILHNWEIIEYNPASKIPRRAIAESNKYEELTSDEKKAIEQRLKQHFTYYVCTLIVYHTGIRPKEVLALKISDIDLERQLININPDLKEENSKTKTKRRVPINAELTSLLQELNLRDYPANYYVFGKHADRSGKRGNKCVSVGHSDFLKSSPIRVRRNLITETWDTIVKKELGINKYLYALKHTGADDKIMAGVDLDALRSMYGHSNKKMTERYVKQIKEVYKNEIIDKSPSFTQAKVIKIA